MLTIDERIQILEDELVKNGEERMLLDKRMFRLKNKKRAILDELRKLRQEKKIANT